MFCEVVVAVVIVVVSVVKFFHGKLGIVAQREKPAAVCRAAPLPELLPKARSAPGHLFLHPAYLRQVDEL